MALPQPVARAPGEADARALWQLPSGAPVLRSNLRTLAQPCLQQPQHTPRFLFHGAAVLLIAAGRLDLDDGVHRMAVDASPSLLLVEANACAGLLKTPGGTEQRFRSVFLALPATLLEAFHRSRPVALENQARSAPFRQMPLDGGQASTLRHVHDSVIAQACGYQSRARFAERFRARFGYLPSAVR